MSTTLVWGRIGALVGSNIAGILLEHSCNAMFLIGGVILFICMLLSYFVLSSKSSRHVET